MQNSSFYLCFHAFLRSKFSPDQSVPIETPYPPFLAIIPLYRPSIPPTCSSNVALPKFHRNFLPVQPVLIQNPYPGNLVLIPPYRFFSHPTCDPPGTMTPRVGNPSFSKLSSISIGRSHNFQKTKPTDPWGHGERLEHKTKQTQPYGAQYQGTGLKK